MIFLFWYHTIPNHKTLSSNLVKIQLFSILSYELPLEIINNFISITLVL